MSCSKNSSVDTRISMLHWLDSTLLGRMLEPLNISRGSLPILAEVLKRGEVIQDDINTMMGTDRAATSRALKKLESQGLVSRKENPKNGRQKLVYATMQAYELSGAMFEKLIENDRVLFDGFTAEERSKCLEFLDRMAANVSGKLAERATE